MARRKVKKRRRYNPRAKRRVRSRLIVGRRMYLVRRVRGKKRRFLIAHWRKGAGWVRVR